MKAFVIDRAGTGAVKEIPTPVPGEDEVLLAIKAAGLCGTDVHIYRGEFYSRLPLVPGHEFAGVIAQVGRNVKRFKVGQRVTADPNIFCEKCDYCQRNVQNFCRDFAAIGVTRDGAFAEYVAVPEACVFPLGDLDFRTAAFIEPLACVVYGQERARPQLGDGVLILGAGPIGLLHLQLARQGGAASVAVTDIRSERLHLAEELGADLTVLNDDQGQARLRAYAPDGFGLVIDTTGVPRVLQQALAYVKNAGTMLIFGVCPPDETVPFSPYEIYKRDLRIVGSFALKKTFQPAIDLLRNGRIDVSRLIGEEITLEQLPAQIERMSAGETSMKTIVYPSEGR